MSFLTNKNTNFFTDLVLIKFNTVDPFRKFLLKGYFRYFFLMHVVFYFAVSFVLGD